MRRLLIWGGSLLGAFCVLLLLMTSMGASVRESDLTFGKAETGSIDVTVTGSGVVTPAYEEIITSPITSRIEEVYMKAGDSVNAGTPLLRLDLMNTEAELSRLSDRIAMQQHEVEQQRLNNSTRLSDLQMQAEVKEMTLRRLEAELRNERYLDSIGSGTGDRVRQAELAVNTGRLELRQLQQLIENESKVALASEGIKELEHSIAIKNLDEMRRTLDHARITAPRRATLTWINDHVGEQVTEGTRLAVVSDLGHFKVKGQMPDAFASKIFVGSRAKITIGRKEMEGIVSNLTPLSENGVISFEVSLDVPSDPSLHSGLKTDIYIICGVVDQTTFIPRSGYYSGPGDYEMFVRNGTTIEKRTVTLGDANNRKVEVKSGISPGESVVISDTKPFEKSQSIKLK